MSDPFALSFYKFRGLDNLPFLFDILINQRLFCSPYRELNDPFEGQYKVIRPSLSLDFGKKKYAAAESEKDFKPELHAASDELRVCSLSSVSYDVRMWSLYAGGHTGVAVEVSLNPADTDELQKVNYLSAIPSVLAPILGDAKCEHALTTKTDHWEYESEWRILTKSPYFNVSGKITRLILGLRTPTDIATALERVCTPVGIPVSRTTLCRETTRVIRVD